MNKIYIWSLPTRVFHALFASFIVLAFITGDEDRLLDYHAIIGYAILILLLFRFIWGFIGPKYSRFKDFPLGKENVIDFIKTEFFTDKSKFTGHNPLASYVMISMLIVAFLAIFTGILAFGIQEGKGILSSLNSSMFKEMELFEEIHEFLSSLFLVLLAAHIGGILTDKLLHSKNETLKSIFTGYKISEEKEGISLNIFQKLIAVIFLSLLISYFVYNIIETKNPLIASSYKEINYKKENPLFVSECASCHTLYPSQSFT